MISRTHTSIFASFMFWLQNLRGIRRFATVFLVALAPLLIFITYLVLGPFQQGSDDLSLRLVLLADVIYILVIATLVLAQVARLVTARRAKSAGSRLHLRLTTVFAALALIPTILVAVFAMLTINIALEGWFSDRVRNVVGFSLSSAQAYEKEHREGLINDTRALALSFDLARRRSFEASDRELLSEQQRFIQRGLTEAYLIDSTGEIRARGDRSYLFDFEKPNVEHLKMARENGFSLIQDWPNNEYRALVPINSHPDWFLYVSRGVDGEILSLLDETQKTVHLYQQLEQDRGRRLFEFGMLYLSFALILVLAAIWLGLGFAETLAGPVGRLAGAAQQVGAGDLEVKVLEERGNDEISMLSRYFNQMTRQLKQQRDTLIENTKQIEQRRRMFDSVLTSVTSGVVGLDVMGRVSFVNRSATRLLDWHEDQKNLPLNVAVPEFGEMFEKLKNGSTSTIQSEIKVTRNGYLESLLVRMSTRNNQNDVLEGYVVAFDDVSDLVSAQRMAAWGDVARRIAHEIKNPLTPIQLSAERIRRKFSPKLGEDSDQLEQMTDVIIRQTNDLRHIVDEFSKFARMPEPNRKVCDLSKVIKDAVTLQRAGLPDVEISLALPDESAMLFLDETMISQALTNLIKNSGEAISSYITKTSPENFKGKINIDLIQSADQFKLTIADNGIGLPEDRASLFEPYVTTREEGTGLGLPIVKKIIEEHGAALSLEDAPIFTENKNNAHFGAMAVITFDAKANGETLNTRENKGS